MLFARTVHAAFSSQPWQHSRHISEELIIVQCPSIDIILDQFQIPPLSFPVGHEGSMLLQFLPRDIAIFDAHYVFSPKFAKKVAAKLRRQESSKPLK